MAGIIDRSENGGRTVGPDLEVKPPRLPLGCVDCVSRSGSRVPSTSDDGSITRKRLDSPVKTPVPGRGDGIGMGRITQRLRVPSPRTHEFGGGSCRIDT
jgi:hypothetical protein